MALPHGPRLAAAPRVLLIGGASDASTPAAAGAPRPFAELDAALAASRAKLEELSKAAEIAKAVGQLRQELAEARASNQSLTAELEGVRAQRAQSESARREAEERSATLQDALGAAKQETVRLNDELSTARARIAETDNARGSAEHKREQALQEARALRDETSQLRADLATAQRNLEQARASREQLVAEVASLRSAAASATNVARQNLLTTQNRIEALTAALQGVSPTLDAEPAAGAQTEAAAAATDDAANNASLEVAADSAGSNAAPPNGTSDGSPVAAIAPPASRAGSDLERYKSDGALPEAVAELTSSLPLEQRLQAQSLLADLKVGLEPRGLKLTVPGTSLFKVNSEEIEDTAYDTLAKVAELLDLYQDRKVLIVGHTDTIGEASYNKDLSERRARLVKQFFVDNFEIDGSRVSTEGMGEEQPITSNSTRAGRQANRRVDVLLLN